MDLSFAFIQLIFLYICLPLVYTKISRRLYQEPKDCSQVQFFDTVTLTCKNCSHFNDLISSQELEAKFNPDAFKIRSEDGLSCNCRPLFYEMRKNNRISCSPCPNGTVTSLNRLSCAVCSPEFSFDPIAKSCKPCQNNSILVERVFHDQNIAQYEQFCQPCPLGTRSDVTTNSCIPCHSSFHNCSCSLDKNTVYDGICLPNFNLIPEKANLYQIHYDNGDVITSAHFSTNFQSSIYNCQFGKNRTACQILANLCTLLNYNYFDAFVQSDINACTELIRLSKLPEVPFVLYLDNSRREIYKKNSVHEQFKINSQVNIVAARYTANGQLIDYSTLRLGELQLCKGEPEALNSGFYFGTNFHQKCTLSVKDLWKSTASDANKLILYDLFLMDSKEGDKDIYLYPIPVLIYNLKLNGENINHEIDEEKWQLVRRFYLSEALVGIELKSTSKDELSSLKKANGEYGDSQHLRYAQKISLNIEVSKNDGSGSIYPPLLTINYGTVSRSDLINQAQVSVEFSINYTMDQTKSSRDFSICLGTFSSIAVAISLFHAWCWSKRQGKQVVDPLTIFQFLIICSGYLADAFFLVSLGLALHWLIIYKKQSVVYGLLPIKSLDTEVQVYIYCAFVLKAITIIHDLIILSHTKIFLIDWEKPKVKATFKRAKSEECTETSNTESSSAAPSNEKKTNINLPGIGLIRTTSEKSLYDLFPAVSIWRTYFVANELMDLCTHRRVNTHIHLLSVMLLLHCIGLENFSSSDTKNNFRPSTGQTYVPESYICRFAIGSFTYLILALIQIIYKRTAYERLFKNKVDEFVDLCSVSNISFFCLLHRRFGYYIHGRSSNGRADVNMKEMHELLKREEDDLCSKRGLLPNCDQQTFEMLLPSSISDQCKRIRSILTSYSQGADRMQGVGGHLFRVDIEKIVPTYLMLNKFLSGFIEHAFKDVDYIVKEKSNVELILNFELSEPKEKGLLYHGNYD